MQNFGIESILKPPVWNEYIHQDSKDNCVKIVKFATKEMQLLIARCFRT